MVQLRRWAHWTAKQVGEPLTFFIVFALVLAWIGLGVWWGYSEEWQNWMDIPATLLPFLMLFLLQMSQNFDSKALHTKLDEVIIALQETNNDVAELEETNEGRVEEERERQKECLRGETVITGDF